MDRDELLRMLDIKSKPVDKPSVAPVPTVERRAPTTEEMSPTVLELDAWDISRGDELLHDHHSLAEKGVDSFSMADFHGATFNSEVSLSEFCYSPRRWEFLNTLLETVEFKALRKDTVLNSEAAELAAVKIAEEYSLLLEKDKCKGKEDGKDLLDCIGGVLKLAGEEVEALLESQRAISFGGPGTAGKTDPKKTLEIYRRIRGNPTLRRVCELAGRYRRMAQSKQKVKVVHGYDDMVGVELSGDVGRILPSELGKLCIPDLELDMLRRIVENQCMSREYHSCEKVGKGPIIVVVDESGSMQGEKEYTAKALALAMAWIAKHQKRWCGLIAYSGDTGHRLVSLPPKKWDELALMDWVVQFIGGGSYIDVPVREMPEFYKRIGAPPGKTDLIFISDAQCDIPKEVQESFKLWKTEVQAKLITLLVGRYHRSGTLEEISDEYHVVENLGITEAGVERVLSI